MTTSPGLALPTAPAPRGGIDVGDLQRPVRKVVPYSEWAARVRLGTNLDVARIDAAIRYADAGLMWPLTDMTRESLSLNPHAEGLIGKRLLPLSTADYDITPAEGEGVSPRDALKVANVVRSAFKGLNVQQAVKDLAFGFVDGRAALEIQWARRDGYLVPCGLHWIVPQRLSFGSERELIIVDRWTDSGMFTPRGPRLRDQPGRFNHVCPREFGDLQEREGLGPRFIYWIFFDRFGWRHRILLTESFGLPWRITETAISEQYGTTRLPRVDGEPDDSLGYATDEADRVTTEGSWVGLPGQKLRVEYPPAELQDFFGETSDQIMARLEMLALHRKLNADASRAGEVVIKSAEDTLFQAGGLSISGVFQRQLVDMIVEINFGFDGLPLAPKFQIRTQPDRDRMGELNRADVLVNKLRVPLSVEAMYEVAGYRPPNKGEERVKGTIFTLTPTDVAAIARVDEGREAYGLEELGGTDGAKWILEQSAAYSAFGAAKGEAAGTPTPPPGSAPAAPPGGAIAKDEGSSSTAIGALKDLLESADEEDQRDAADEEATAGFARLYLAGERLVQPSIANGSPDVLVEKGAREGVRATQKWAEELLDVADGDDAARIYRRLDKAAAFIDLEQFTRAVERRIVHGLMLGSLDADFETHEDAVIKPAAFSAAAAVGVKDFVTLPFGEALQAFASRKILTRRAFDRLLASAKRRAFTVAGLARKEMVSTAHDELSKAIESGDDLRGFSSSLAARFDAAGWTKLNPSHVETVFRTGVMGAYSDGRRAQMTLPAVLEARPYWQILGVKDDRERKTHAAANGAVLRANDPFFARCGPPFGFNCRHRLVSRSAADLQRLGLTPTIGARLRGLPDEGWSNEGSLL